MIVDVVLSWAISLEYIEIHSRIRGLNINDVFFWYRSWAGTPSQSTWIHPLILVGFITQSLVLCFVDRCLSFCLFSFYYCVVCLFSICGLWLSVLVSSNPPFWYLQTLLAVYAELPTYSKQILTNKNKCYFKNK
jgi:hypothetical protein